MGTITSLGLGRLLRKLISLLALGLEIRANRWGSQRVRPPMDKHH